MIDVRVTLMLTRGKDVLLVPVPTDPAEAAQATPDTAADAAALAPAAPEAFTVPATGLDEGESFAEAASRLAESIGFAAIDGLVVQHVAQEARSSGGTALRVALAARVPGGAEPGAGYAFHPATRLPGNLDTLARAVFDTCRSGAHVVDLGGAALPVGLFSRPSAGAAPIPSPDLGDGAQEPAKGTGPSIPAAGVWFGGALLWASSVLLVFDYHRVFRGGSGVVLWAHAFAFAWYGCTRAGASLRGEEESTARRAALVLFMGLAVVLFAALAIGVLGPNARGAYVMLGMLGIPTFFVAQWRSRKGMSALSPRAGPLVLLIEGLAVLGTLAVYAAH